MPNLLAHNHQPVPGWCVPQEHHEPPGKNLCCGNGFWTPPPLGSKGRFPFTNLLAMGVWSFGKSTYLKLNIWYTLANGKHLQGRKDKAWWWLIFDNHSCICFSKGRSHQTFTLSYLIPRHHNHFPTNHPTPYLNIPPQHPTIHGTFRTRGQSSATGATKGCYAIAPHLGSYRLNFAVRHVQDICSPQGAAGGRGVTSIVAAAFAAHGICVWSGRLGIEIQFWAWRDVPKEGA